ncbi:hypothetical protein [Citrobacter arsenatis]|uniref:hypothetical protein n=1 Tax=Citrobacter arsenatis TaxID=2546350 RepID=UPI00300E34A6
MTLCNKAALLVLFFSMPAAWAFHIDTLMRVVEKDTEYLEITGEHEREYIYTQLTQVITDKNGEIKERPLNPEQVSSWPIIVEPGEIVLNKSDKVRVRITRNGQQQDNDQVMGLAFIPEKVSGKPAESSGLNIAVGYKAWLFILGKSLLKGQVTATRKDGYLVIDNMTNKILRIVPMGCSEYDKEECRGALISLPQTRKQIDVTDGIRSLDIYLINDSQKKVKVITL